MNLQLTPSGVTLYTNGETDLTTSFNEALDKGKAIHINVETRKIARLEMVPDNEGIMIHFEDETYALEAFLAHRSYMEERSTLAQQLGLEKNDDGDIIAKSPFNETSVRGVFASGDNVGLMKVATHAMWTGSLVGCGVACQLQADASGHRGLFDC
jgi:thioredoxin reductase